MRILDPLAHARARARLLDAARHVFAAQGYHAASMNDVAARAGVAKAAVYHYFKGKHSLLEALHEDLWAGPAAKLAAAKRPRTLRDALAFTGAEYVSHFREAKAAELMRIAFNVSVMEPELMRISSGTLMPRVHELMISYFAPLFPKGSREEQVARHVMPFFGALFHYLFVLRPTCPENQLPGDVDAYLAYLVAVFSRVPKVPVRRAAKDKKIRRRDRS